MSEYTENNILLNDEADKNLKCGIITVSKSCSFSLVCSVCKAQFKNFKGFTKHITETHSYYDFDENPEDEDEMMNYEDDDYLAHEPAVEVNYLPQNDMDVGNDPDDSQDPYQNDDDETHNSSSIQLPIMKYEDDENGPLTSMFDDCDTPTINRSTGGGGGGGGGVMGNGDGKMFPCKLCEKSYYYSSSLNKHVRKFHPGTPLSSARPSGVTVPQRNQSSFSDNSLSISIKQERRRPNAPLHQCPKCPPDAEGFRTKRLLEQHNIEIHINARKFVCMFCPAAYNLKKNLTQHEQTMHLDKRPFRCEICSFAFKERKHLIRHERTHTGEKPFKCNLCDESFTRMDKKKHHMKKHEEDGDYIPDPEELDAEIIPTRAIEYIL